MAQDWKDRLRSQGAPEDVLADPMKAMAWLQAQKDDADAKLKAEQSQPVRFRISEKSGAVMALGLGQYPTTLYASQWQRLIEGIPVLKTYLADNAAKITATETAAKAVKAATGTDGK